MRRVAERADVIPLLAEVFREFGFEGASLARITAATGLGKGSLYHFFPGGKEEMATAVLAEIDAWFEREIYAPLRDGTDAAAAIAHMFDASEAYFRSGRRVCLVGAFALGDTRDRFAAALSTYFAAWVEALDMALRRLGWPAEAAAGAAAEAVGAIQGAIVLARALDRPDVFTMLLDGWRRRFGRI
ncbi:TetR/AcrR family transcriptional regulator [Zavarzinia compransoris]|uniref:TetR/AcrR family transcriptional regulator n=1 Tax=Zavarzinia marina TaxID=2911065 RepID=UPI001F329304|nr:TetR/AcrR family transcriptional regulator [Zavarzinia marina]MCF4166263.1 TetR/AcrR family transcriptional regulator [Zavarzinia marina]